MNPHSAWRLELARHVAAEYIKNNKVAAIMVAGSVGRDLADEWSDLELDIYWHEPPTDDDRKRVIEAVGGEIVYYFPHEGNEWSDAYIVRGLKFEISSFLASTIEQFSEDVTTRFDTDWEKQLRMAALNNSIPLYGQDLVERLRAKNAHYPDGLAEKIIRENIDFGGWNSVEFAFARGHLLMAFDLMSRVQRQMLYVLLALNRIYMGHPRGKWLEQFTEGMQHKPVNFAARTHTALSKCSPEGACEYDSVIAETFELVAQQFPQIDLTEIKKDVWFRRQPITGPQ